VLHRKLEALSIIREVRMTLVDTGNLMIWYALRPYLPPGTRLTSVYRPAQAQLDFIVRKATKEGYHFAKPPVLGDRTSWAGALGFIRQKGYQVAEPGLSKHQRGMAYDLSGPDLDAIEAAVRKAVAAGRISLLRGSNRPIRPETINRCIHVEIEAAILDFEPFDVG
jgi:hypothetical protein